jgi:glycosyltransferase involved in cell wall biosynthesis
VDLPVLFIDHASGLGGAERSLLLLLRYLDRDRFAPHLVSTGGPLAQAARQLDVVVHVVPLPRLRRSPRALLDWGRGVRTIVRIARDIHARALVANTVRAAFYTAPAVRIAHIPFVWYMRDFWLGEDRPRTPALDRLGKRFLGALATQVVANSEATAAHLPCPGKTAVIPNGIEVARFDPQLEGECFRVAHAIPSAAPVIGMVGRLRPWKGQARFIRVFDRVQKQLPQAHSLIVGGNPLGEEDRYAASLGDLARTLGLEARIHFTGQLDDPRPALAAMDVFVHAGDPEPFGLVNVEAMAMAKPVVAFNHGALPEIVLDGETGLLVSPGDVEAMARALLALLADPERGERLGRVGRERVERHFDVHLTARRFQNLLQSTLGDVMGG